jgi:hypothetical protein
MTTRMHPLVIGVTSGTRDGPPMALAFSTGMPTWKRFVVLCASIVPYLASSCFAGVIDRSLFLGD